MNINSEIPMQRLPNQQAGFTLLEALIVIVCSVILVVVIFMLRSS